MSQYTGETNIDGWPIASCADTSSDAWSRYRTKAQHPPRSRSHLADLVINVVCLTVAYLAIGHSIDREVLFEQYDFKLWSQSDRLFVFCLSLLPTVLAMSAIFVATKTLTKIQSIV
jgi:hypothetical protein